MQAVNVRIIQIALLVVLLGGWQLGVTSGAIDRFFFPAPYDIVKQVIDWVADAGFYKHVGITLSETVLGYIIGTGLGVGALLSGWASAPSSPACLIRSSRP